jgi:predicted ATPase
MRIKRLWVSEYKNITDLNLNFKSNFISLLVGQNGLGKSNLIEVLALIFKDLDLLKNKDDFEDWPYKYFEYDILYECYGTVINIICKKSMFQVWSKPEKSQADFEEVSLKNFNKWKHSIYLPKYIIGYYSGENRRIRDIIRPYESRVWNELRKNEGLDNDLRRLFFSENHHAEMILLTLLLYKDSNENFSKKVKYLIDSFTSFSYLTDFNLVLKNPSWYKSTDPIHKQKGIDFLEENYSRRVEFPFWDIKGQADKIIRILFNCSTSYPIYYTDEKSLKEIVELNEIDYQMDNIAGKFDLAIDFFNAFEMLKQIDVISSIDLKVGSKQHQVNFDFSQLSEGEAQLITVLGLILISGTNECLFLLDEPDTHLNPQWQREYVNLIHRFTLNNENSHFIIATHSPLIVQAADKADIFLYKREDDKIVVESEDLKIRNWRIDQVLASEYFDLESTRPPQLDDFMKEREQLLSKPQLTQEDIEKIKSFAEIDDLLPSGETLDDFRALHLIHITANRLESK